jgi:hypothetical protein
MQASQHEILLRSQLKKCKELFENGMTHIIKMIDGKEKNSIFDLFRVTQWREIFSQFI